MIRRIALMLSFLLCLAGCRDAIRRLSPPKASPITIDMVVDTGDESAVPEEVAATIAHAVDVAVTRPGSVIRLFHVGEYRVSESRLVQNYVVRSPSRPSRRAVLLHQRQQRQAATTQLQKAASELFADRTRKQTRLADTLSVVSLAGNPSGGQRVLWIESDMREVNSALGIDLECTLPPPDALLASLDRAGLLRPGSLADAAIWIVHARPRDVERDRCLASIQHFEELHALWRAVLERTGARVFVTSGLPEVSQ